MNSLIATAEEIYAAAAAAGARPEPVLTISDWADRHRILSQRASAEPGPWRTDRTPYLREIMDCLSPSSPIERTVFMKGAQIGATEAGNNWIGYVIHQSPGPMMAVQPTVEMAKRNSKQRVDALIEESDDRGVHEDPAHPAGRTHAPDSGATGQRGREAVSGGAVRKLTANKVHPAERWDRMTRVLPYSRAISTRTRISAEDEASPIVRMRIRWVGSYVRLSGA